MVLIGVRHRNTVLALVLWLIAGTASSFSLVSAFKLSILRRDCASSPCNSNSGLNLDLNSHQSSAPVFRSRINLAMVGEKATSQPKNVVILGGGIIGASIAYQLSKRGVCPTVVERSKVAAAASGKSGGFLAESWGDGSVTQQLHRVSFRMHEELARELGVKSYRKIETLNVAGGRTGKTKPPVAWLDGQVAKASLMDKWTAQVTPLELTEALMAGAIARGATLRIGKAEGVQFESGGGGDRRVKAVLVDGQPLPCDCVIVAMGPWSCIAEEWFDTPVPMEGVKSTSVIYHYPPPADGGPQAPHVAQPAALFCAEDANGCHLEVYPRPNGDIYICGIGGSDYLNSREITALAPEAVGPRPERVEAARASFGGLSSLGARPPDVAQACMRPCPPDALPMIGAVPGCANAYLAAGHNCWGILWAPVTGVAVAELVLDGRAACVDLGPFAPARFRRDGPGRGGGERGRHQEAQAVGEQW